MKIATRIISGYGVLIALLALILGYQVVAIHRMQSIGNTVSRVNFQAAIASLQLMRDRDLVEEYAKKALVLGDPEYTEQLRSFMQDLNSSLELIQSKPLSGREREEVDRVAQFWDSFRNALSREQARGTVTRQAFPAELQDALDTMRTQCYTVYQRLLESIATEAERSRETGRRAEMLSWFAALSALVISALVSLLIVRSISIPLKQLTEGTRAIAAGKFYYRLDTSGNDEFAQVARDFNTMTERLGELDIMKKEFVSHVSHELKAPLASMRETTQLLLERIPGPLSDKQQRLLELNMQSARTLSSIIGNLLDMSKIEAGIMEYDLRPQPLTPLVGAALAQYEAQAAEKKIALGTELPAGQLLVDCDGDRIVQVIANLLGNAVKFTPKGGVIRVRVERVAEAPGQLPPKWHDHLSDEEPSDGFALVTVADSGPGVPDPNKETIFEKFHRATPKRKQAGQGVGLGLAISQTVIEAHRGAIWVQDNPRGGSVFCVLLRANRASVEAPAERRASDLES
jgi:signal transduction histidine kinase